MIGPQPVDEPAESPLDSLVATIKLLARNHAMLTQLMPGSVANETLYELSLLLEAPGNRLMNIRSVWVRRVAAPVLMAHRVLNSEEGTLQQRARLAITALESCSDVAVVTICSKWIRNTHHVA